MICYPFIEAEKQGDHNVKRACELLQVSRSAYYADRTSGPSLREQRDTELTAKIIRIHDDSRHTYGSPRVHHERQAQGERCSRKPVVLGHGVPPDQIARRICSHRSWEGEESDAISQTSHGCRP